MLRPSLRELSHRSPKAVDDRIVLYIACMHHAPMNFEFDPAKATANFRKHGVSFAEVEPVFYDDFALTREDRDAMRPERCGS